MTTTTPVATSRTPRGASWGVRLVGLLLLLGLVGAASAAPASAHPLSTTAVLLDIGDTAVTGQLQIPLDRLAIAVEDPTLTPETVVEPAVLDRLRTYVQNHTAASGADGTPWTTTVSGGRVEAVDGVDHLVLDLALTPPAGREAQTDDFVLDYDAVVEHLLSHQILVSARSGDTGDRTTAGLITWQDHELPVQGYAPARADAGAATTGASAGFWTSVRLGVDHIAGGADHLLFLVTLLLPAPLVVSGGRWVRRDDLRRASWRVVHVVTAFAVGHSTTLALAALGFVHVDTRVVESLIAVSILAAAVHAIKPLVRGGEALIAVGFGLVHGLAFAALVDELGLGRGGLLVDLLGFNLGIEVTQLLVVALLVPSLILLSRTRAHPVARTTGAVVAGVLAAGWLLERTGLLATNPLDGLTEAAVHHAVAVAVAVAVLAVTCWCVPQLRAPGRTAARTPEGAVAGPPPQTPGPLRSSIATSPASSASGTAPSTAGS